MSKNIKLKRIALIAISALGLGMLGIAPASAAITLDSNSTFTISSATETVGVGTSTSRTIGWTPAAITFDNDTTEDRITITLSSITVPTGSAKTIADVTLTQAAAVATSSKFTIGARVGDTYRFDQNATTTAVATANVATVAFTPDVEGTYVITLADGAANADKTLTVTAVGASTVASIYVSKNSASSNWATRTADGTSLTTSASVTLAGATASNFVSTDIGKGLYSLANGYLGLIQAYTNADGTTAGSVTLAANAAVAVTNVTDLYVGSVASTKTASTIINANGISAITLTSAKSAALQVGLTNALGDSDGKVRLSLPGTGVIATSAAIASSATVGIIPFTVPTMTPGTYNFAVSYSASGSFLGTNADQIDITLAITISAASQLSIAQSTAYMDTAGDAASSSNYTATTNAVPRSAVKTAGNAIAGIEVTLRNEDGTAHALQPTVTASVSGSGFVLVDTTATTTTVGVTNRSSSAAATSAGLAYVHIATDGTAGTGTVTVSVTDAVTLATSTLGTFTVTSYGNATKLEVSTTNFTIGRSGAVYTTGGAVAARAASTEIGGGTITSPLYSSSNLVSTPAFIIKVTDANGNLVNLTDAAGAATVPTIVSSNSTAVTGGSCVLDDGSSTTWSSGKGVGYYNCNFSSGPAGKSGDKATLTIRTPNPADRTTYLTTTVDVSLGGSAATGTTTLSLDKATYAPGEGMTITVKAVDSSGNPVYDGAPSPAVTFSKQIGGSTLAADMFVGGTINSDNALGAKTAYAPVVAGTFTATATSASLATLTATATVSDDAATAAATAASDAAAEAIDAANAATDAANLAAEAADAATVAAEEARDAADAATAAVAELAAQFETLVASVKSQLNTLAGTINKIAKRVKKA